MIFKRLLRTRIKPSRIPDDQDALIGIVRGHEDTALRREACRRIIRLPELREIAKTDVDAGVREIAAAHFRNLLCAPVTDLPRVAERIAEIGSLDDQPLLTHVAGSAREPDVRQAAIARLESPEVIADCAINDPLSVVRCAAVERLAEKFALDRVIKNIGRRDKKVYRIARTKLKEIAEREALPERIRAQCAELCEKVERLGRYETWVQDRGRLDVLDRQWTEIEHAADHEWRARYQALREQFLTGYEAYRRQHEALVAAEEARESFRKERGSLLEELSACAGLHDETILKEQIERVVERWSVLGQLPEKEQTALERRYADLLARATERRDDLIAQHQRNTRLHKQIRKLERALDQSAPLERSRIRSLVEEIEPLVTAAGADKDLAEGFAQLRERLEARLTKQKRHAEQRLAELPQKLDELAAALDRGELKHAEPLYQSAQAGLDLAQATGLSRNACNAAAEGLHMLAPRLRELQKWRKWGSDQHRDQLCLAMEELAQADIPMEAVALRLHDLQMEWKGLDRAGSPVNQPLWDRFHALSEQVYERCKPYLEAQAAEREANRERRVELCERLEDFLDKVDWERMDWKKAIRAEREMRQAWAACGPVESRHRKALEKRFHNGIRQLDQHLSEERARNQAHKRTLIEGVEALIDEADLDRAIEETKRLQRQWHTTVPARQKEENKLWQRFRAASDAVFSRRRERHEAHLAELAENLKQREAICDEAARLTSADAAPEELGRALGDLAARWRDTESLPIPRESARQLSQRWSEIRYGVEQHRQELLKARRRESMDLLARQAALCEGIERALEAQTGPDPQTDAAEAQWQTLPRQSDSRLQAAIERRFRSAVDALSRGAGSHEKVRGRMDADGRRRAELCLHLEILAGIESPPELTHERLAFQVNRLREHMREGEKDPLEGASRLLEEWYLCGPAPAAEAPALEERFRRASAALDDAAQEHAAA